MEGKTKKKVIQYIISIVLAGLIVLLIVLLRGKTDTLQDTYRKYCDAFTVSGGLFLSFALLLRISDEGIFDGAGYVGRKILGAFIPMLRLQNQSYADYKIEKKEKRGEKDSEYKSFLFIGLAYFLVGMIFLVLYYNV